MESGGKSSWDLTNLTVLTKQKKKGENWPKEATSMNRKIKNGRREVIKNKIEDRGLLGERSEGGGALETKRE